MNVKVLNTWHAALDDASRNSTIEGLRLSIINALEAMAPEFDDDNSEMLYDEWCTDHSLVVAISVSYSLLNARSKPIEVELDLYESASSRHHYHRMAQNLERLIDSFTDQFHNNT